MPIASEQQSIQRCSSQEKCLESGIKLLVGRHFGYPTLVAPILTLNYFYDLIKPVLCSEECLRRVGAIIGRTS